MRALRIDLEQASRSEAEGLAMTLYFGFAGGPLKLFLCPFRYFPPATAVVARGLSGTPLVTDCDLALPRAFLDV